MDVMVLGLYLNVCGLYCEKLWYYPVCEDYNGAVSKVLGDKWINPRILSVQSLEAHQRLVPFTVVTSDFKLKMVWDTLSQASWW